METEVCATKQHFLISSVPVLIEQLDRLLSIGLEWQKDLVYWVIPGASGIARGGGTVSLEDRV